MEELATLRREKATLTSGFARQVLYFFSHRYRGIVQLFDCQLYLRVGEIAVLFVLLRGF